MSEPLAYPGPSVGTVDDWSRDIYLAVQNWPLAASGKWSWLKAGHLSLRIEQVEGRSIEPIELDTWNEELTVAFGGWHDHLSTDLAPPDDVPDVVMQAKALVDTWLGGELRTAVLTDESGRWCGTSTIDRKPLLPQLRQATLDVRNSSPVRIELRSPYMREWQSFDIDPEWLLPPKLSPDRLP